MFERHGTPASRRLFPWFAGTTIIPALGLGWLGWQMVEQDRRLEGQRLSIGKRAISRYTISPRVVMGWSRDGTHLLFSSDRGGNTGLWALPMSNGNPQGPPFLIRPNTESLSLGTTASGALYLGVLVSNLDIHIASIDFSTGKLLTAPVRPVHNFVGFNVQSDWSPDGKYLSYISSRSQTDTNRVLVIRSIETGQVRESPLKLRYFNWPRWTSDGRSLITKGIDVKGRDGVYRIDTQTFEVTPIAQGLGNNAAFSGPIRSFPLAIHPDGRQIAFLAGERKAEVWVLENFLPVLNAKKQGRVLRTRLIRENCWHW